MTDRQSEVERLTLQIERTAGDCGVAPGIVASSDATLARRRQDLRALTHIKPVAAPRATASRTRPGRGATR